MFSRFKSSGSRSSASGFPFAPSQVLSGVSLKPAYYHEILESRPKVGFFEIHAENYLSDGGPGPFYLEKIRSLYPITIHGVGMSIGSETAIDRDHLDRVKRLVDRFQPEVFSEHLAWSTHGPAYLNDLLPVAYNKRTLDRVCYHIDELQDHLKRRVLIENPSTYIAFKTSDMSEIEFISEMASRTGCGLLLDVNNVEVSCFNHDTDPYDYLNNFPHHEVGQIHLAGHTLDENPVRPLKIDSHDAAVDQDVWSLYQHTLKLAGDMPTLIERDGNLPSLAALIQEAEHADALRKMMKKEVV
ncbi:DUF692 domain-containing protein [Marinomonas mediterranea]|uniref:MNIO family bufferin maturase n=1 Tax=Marinomonas mediterranea TaxID=119864 RepID=UPI00234A9467|nr:DUF692 domain-containing protein [Marinomonas mediterranea]WCN07590.1 DUF692 family protein [Marinomonas mediterranea]WCN11689.1 DUF692 family protein [Marinomonas mediterranea]